MADSNRLIVFEQKLNGAVSSIQGLATAVEQSFKLRSVVLRDPKDGSQMPVRVSRQLSEFDRYKETFQILEDNFEAPTDRAASILQDICYSGPVKNMVQISFKIGEDKMRNQHSYISSQLAPCIRCEEASRDSLKSFHRNQDRKTLLTPRMSITIRWTHSPFTLDFCLRIPRNKNSRQNCTDSVILALVFILVVCDNTLRSFGRKLTSS